MSSRISHARWIYFPSIGIIRDRTLNLKREWEMGNWGLSQAVYFFQKFFFIRREITYKRGDSSYSKIPWHWFFKRRRWQSSGKEQVYTTLVSSELFGYQVIFFFMIDLGMKMTNTKNEVIVFMFIKIYSTHNLQCVSLAQPQLCTEAVPECQGASTAPKIGPGHSLNLMLTWRTDQFHLRREKSADHSLEEWGYCCEAHSSVCACLSVDGTISGDRESPGNSCQSWGQGLGDRGPGKRLCASLGSVAWAGGRAQGPRASAMGWDSQSAMVKVLCHQQGKDSSILVTPL